MHETALRIYAACWLQAEALKVPVLIGSAGTCGSDSGVDNLADICREICAEAGAWHGAKIAECGALCTTNPSGGGVFVTFDEEGFVVEPTSADSRCTAYSVSAHMLYENADPYCLREPPGTLDTHQSVYEQLDDRRLRVTGSSFTREPYTIKLEGSALAGYQTVTLVGAQDTRVLADPDSWIQNLQSYVEAKISKYEIDSSSYIVDFKLYGWGVVSGKSPKHAPEEIGVLMTVTASSQQLVTRIAKIYNPFLLHFPIKLKKQLPTYAFVFSPAETERGPIYEFALNHAVEVADPIPPGNDQWSQNLEDREVHS